MANTVTRAAVQNIVFLLNRFFLQVIIVSFPLASESVLMRTCVLTWCACGYYDCLKKNGSMVGAGLSIISV